MTDNVHLINLSKWVTYKLFDRSHMTLSAFAYEKAHLNGWESTAYSTAIDLLFWFDPDHCRSSYIHYRAERRTLIWSRPCR